MSRYRRSNAAGATFFFTLATHRRQRILCDEPVRRALRDADFGFRWGWIKRLVTRAVAAEYERAEWRNPSRITRREPGSPVGFANGFSFAHADQPPQLAPA